MMLDKRSIDLVLVPAGLAIMFGYHLFLLYRILRFPETTVIGFENHNKRAWVQRMLLTIPREAKIAQQVMSSSVAAATNLAALSIALSALIGAWIWGSASPSVLMDAVIYGDKSQATFGVKYVFLLACFLASFVCFIQAARCFVQAGFLLSTPDSDVPASYVEDAVIKGSHFWSLGLRALYFATALLLWVFGPIPMFACSLFMVILLASLDYNSTPLHRFRFEKSSYSKLTARSIDGFPA